MNVAESVLLPLIFFLSFASFLVAAVVYFRSEKEPEALQRRFLPRFYAYAMLFVSSLVLLIGGGLLLKAALAFPLGMEFSYQAQPIYGEVEAQNECMEPGPFEGIQYREEDRVRDLLSGAALAAMGAIFLISHQVLRNRVEDQDERLHSFLNKAYLMVSGVVYGGLTLVMLRMGLYQLIEFYFVPRGDPEQTLWNWPIPGNALGYAVVALILWLLVLPHFFRSFGGENPEG
jgi:hypothetical protein